MTDTRYDLSPINALGDLEHEKEELLAAIADEAQDAQESSLGLAKGLC